MSHRVIAAHTSQYPDPIRFGPGDRLRTARRDDEYPGWIWVTTPSGNKGWAPECIIRLETDRQGIALSEYDAAELNTEVGQRVVWVRELCGWVWVENEDGGSGWVPADSIAAE